MRSNDATSPGDARRGTPDPLSGTYDAIVIGSGLGGLTSASLLAQLFGKRVLVLERHFKLGGFTHTFKRAGYRWDVGLHYVGQVGPGGGFERLFQLVTGDGVRWTKMADPFERFVFPDFTFEVRSSREQFRADLVAAFPEEAAAIDQYLVDLGTAVGWLKVHGTRGLVPRPIHAIFAWTKRESYRLARMTTAEYLDAHFRSPRLRAILASQWGDYGLPPSQSSFLIHAIVVRHYEYGGYYPVGTSERIAESIVRVLEAHGGRALPSHEVTRIVVRRGRATGVVVRRRNGSSVREVEIDAPIVISDAGARTTYLKLLEGAGVRLPFRAELEKLPLGYANVTLFLGLRESPAKLGVVGENHWIFDGLDHDEVHRRRNELAEGRAHFAYLSFPSMKDPEAKRHTAQIIAQIDASVFEPWAGGAWTKRGAEYEALKNRIADTLLDFVDRRVPGLRDLVVHREVSTPLSTTHFTGHYGGEIYGLPMTPERLDYDWLSTVTPVKGLYLTGADALAHGIGGALMSGVMTVGAAQGVMGLRTILRRLSAPRP
jgi:phytoene dehydrogenase-like protein